MLRVLFWTLPVVDVFTLPKILEYYRSLGAPVPPRHAKAGLVERWVGYLPLGFVMGWFGGFLPAVLTVMLAFVVTGPLELYLMFRGVRPWNYFRGKDRGGITKVFLLEGYNAVGYFLLGATIGSIL